MHILDILGVLLIFAVLIFVGYRSYKQVENVKDFTLAGQRLGRIQIGFSQAATEFGGSSLVGAMALCYTAGIAGAWWDWSAVPALVILGIFFVGRIRLPNMVTITDFFERRYDRPTRTLASVMHILAITAQLCTQFTVGAVALNGVLGIPKMAGILLSVVFVLLYTMAGGLIADVNADVVQFIVIVISLGVAVPVSLSKVGGFAGLAETLPPEFLSFGNIDGATVISWCLFCFFTYATNQHYIQRVFASKDRATARFSFLFTGGAYFVYGLAVAILGVCIVVLLPGLEDPNMGYSLLIKNYMPAGLAGLTLGGIFAASISTADSMLLAASTLFFNDIYQPIIKKGRPTTEKESLRTIRIVTVITCILSVGIALMMTNIIDIMYLGGLFYSTAVFFPLIIGLWWKRATAPAALISMVAAVVVGLVSEFFLAGQVPGILGLPSNVMAASTSLILFVIISLLTPPPSEEKLAFLSGYKEMK